MLLLKFIWSRFILLAFASLVPFYAGFFCTFPSPRQAIYSHQSRPGARPSFAPTKPHYCFFVLFQALDHICFSSAAVLYWSLLFHSKGKCQEVPSQEVPHGGTSWVNHSSGSPASVSYTLLLLLWIIWGHKLRHICSLSPIIGCELIIVSLKNIHTIKTDFKTVLTSSTGWKNGIFYNSFNNALSQNHHQTWNFLQSYHKRMSWKMCRRGIKRYWSIRHLFSKDEVQNTTEQDWA